MGYIIASNGISYFANHARTVSHKVINVNGKKRNILFKKDIGFGVDTNAIDFSSMALSVIYGGITFEEVKDIISQTIPTEEVLDLSDVPVINKLSDVPTEGSWLYVKERATEDIFANVNYEDEYEEEEDDD